MHTSTHHSRYKPLSSRLLSIFLALSFILSACAVSQEQAPTQALPASTSTAAPVETTGAATAPASPIPSLTSEVTATQAIAVQPPASSGLTENVLPASTPTKRVAPGPEDWKTLPVIPTVSENARQIYQRGIEAGRNPRAFSKIGDCQSITTYFLALFDKPGLYELGDYAHLQETIDWFSGSFERESLAVKGGMNAAAQLSALRADPEQCNKGESPLACELRLHNSSIALISLEEWWGDDPGKYERYMRQIIEYTLSQNVLPVLATKADNLEGDFLINQTIAQLAWEYDIPLWNFWLAVQELPNQGLIQTTADGQPDLFHLTHSNTYYTYTGPDALLSGWAMRNLTALQALDAVQRALNGLPQP